VKATAETGVEGKKKLDMWISGITSLAGSSQEL